jgi:hypothetical protein
MLLITKRNGNVHRNVQVFIGMSKSRQGITNGAETATNVPCDSTGKQRTMRPATYILKSEGPEDPRAP